MFWFVLFSPARSFRRELSWASRTHELCLHFLEKPLSSSAGQPLQSRSGNWKEGACSGAAEEQTRWEEIAGVRAAARAEACWFVSEGKWLFKVIITKGFLCLVKSA